MTGVSHWFETRGEIPLVLPPRLREYGPLADDPDRPFDAFTDWSIHGVAVAIEYCDSHGWASTRLVRCLALDPTSPVSLLAYCNVRQAPRTFRVDRIIAITSYRTGRMLTGEEHVALLAPYLPGTARSPEVEAFCALHREVRDGVFALLQLGMGDGTLTDAARQAVLGYVATEAQATGREAAPELVELWLDNLAPQSDAVAFAVNSLMDKKDKFARLLPWILRIVRSRDTFAVQEQSVRELIEEVRQHFRRKLQTWPDDLRAVR